MGLVHIFTMKHVESSGKGQCGGKKCHKLEEKREYRKFIVMSEKANILED